MSYFSKKHAFKGLVISFLFIGIFNAYASDRWTRLAPPVTSSPAVVEFFSFYCPPCYAFSQRLGIDDAIRQALPEGKQLVKYHVGQLGPLGHELTRAWALAMVIDKTEAVEKALFKANVVDKNLNGSADIRRVFTRATGLSDEEYDRKIISPAVNDLVVLQEKLFTEYGVTGTPSVYVNGLYHINNAAYSSLSVENFQELFVKTILALITDEKYSK